MTKQQQTELAQKAINGDANAFAELYEEYRGALTKYIIKQGAAENDAEDVVSEAFTEAYAHISDLREPAYFGTWLHRIAKNIYTRQSMKEGRALRVLYDDYDDGSERSNDSVDLAAQEGSSLEDIEDTVLLPENYAENEDIKQTLADTILSMKEEFRSAIFLFYYEDRSITEIAEREGVSEGTVKSRLHYAKKKLREKLEPLAKKGGLFAAVPFSRLFNTVDVSENISGGAIVGGAGAAGTGAAASGGSAVSTSAAAISTIGTKITAGIAAALLGGAIVTGVVLLNNRIDNRDPDNNGDISITQQMSIRLDPDAETETMTGTTIPTVVPELTEAPTDTTVPTATTPPEESEKTKPTSRQTAKENQGGGYQPAVTVPERNNQTSSSSSSSLTLSKTATEGTSSEQAEETTLLTSGTEGNLDWTLYGNGILVISGNGDMDGSNYDFNKPHAWSKALQEKETGSEINSADHFIRKVIIENGVTGIGPYAFNGCRGLSEISIPDTVTSIGDCAFNGCWGLTDINIPKSINSIGFSAFQECTSLTKITIPSGVESINDYTFSGCLSLSSITIPDSVINIEEGAFCNCESLSHITIPENVTTIEQITFLGCKSLTYIKIPESVTSIGTFAFAGCESLTSIVIPSNLTSIGVQAFMGCAKLTEITIPSSVTSIKSNVFIYCDNLTVHTPSGSCAEQYCKDNNIPYDNKT